MIFLIFWATKHDLWGKNLNCKEEEHENMITNMFFQNNNEKKKFF